MIFTIFYKLVFSPKRYLEQFDIQMVWHVILWSRCECWHWQHYQRSVCYHGLCTSTPYFTNIAPIFNAENRRHIKWNHMPIAYCCIGVSAEVLGEAFWIFMKRLSFETFYSQSPGNIFSSSSSDFIEVANDGEGTHCWSNMKIWNVLFVPSEPKCTTVQCAPSSQ